MCPVGRVGTDEEGFLLTSDTEKVQIGELTSFTLNNFELVYNVALLPNI